MNKKGFTLVELLAVIVILALLALLTSTAVTKLVSDSKNELSNIQINSIKSAAEAWGADNINKLPDTGECIYMTLKDLKDYGLLDSSVINPKNNQEISNDLKIKITSTTSEYGKTITNYEVDPASIDGCTQIYGPACTIKRQVARKYTIGDEVKCGTEQFYVIENQDTDTTEGIDMLAAYNLTLTESPIQDTTGADNGIVFSSSEYWWDSTNRTYIKEFANQGEHPYIYNSSSNLYPYVEAYRDILEGMGVNVMDAKLLSHEQAINLGCGLLENDTDGYCSTAPSWVSSTDYWLGNAHYSNIRTISYDYYSDWDRKSLSSIRPLITIPIWNIAN